jgi:hypothetical protein
MTSHKPFGVCNNPGRIFYTVNQQQKEDIVIVKKPVLPGRFRKVPKSFSWIDHRLVRNGYIKRCSHAAGILYLFLVCVGDDKGLSFYGDQSLMKKLSMDQRTFENARADLIRIGLVAWHNPLYQVLCLEPESSRNHQRFGSGMSSSFDFSSSSPDKTIYKIYELIEGKATSGKLKEYRKKFHSQFGITNEQFNRFRDAVHNPSVTGDWARHAVGDIPRTENPMSKGEAEQFSRQIASKWIEHVRKLGICNT